MVSVSGVRGRVGEPLTPELMAGIAAALGAHLREVEGGRSVVLGRDSRVSGPMFARAVTSGLQSVGCDVIDVGVVPTPTILMAVRHHGAIGGIGTFILLHAQLLQPHWFPEGTFRHAVNWLLREGPNPYSCAVMGEIVSITLTVVVSKLTQPLPEEHLRQMFAADS